MNTEESITSDVIILGAGIAGASLAAELADRCSVTLIEVEDQPGRHTTGRSAAMYFEQYGPPLIRSLTKASRKFFDNPPEGFTETPLLSPRAALFVAGEESLAALQAELSGADQSFGVLSNDQALEIVPILSRDWLRAAALDRSGFDIDVAALLQGYLKLAKAKGGRIVLSAKATAIEDDGTAWRVTTSNGSYSAPILVNATGAWADTVAKESGVRPLGLRPLRRTAITLAAPDQIDVREWPLVIAADESFYFKPDGGQILLSPANEDEDVPCDVAADELDIAIAIDRFETATSHKVASIRHRWAGLRTFAPDRLPVVGFDPGKPRFFWLAGQGGYGIQTCPALSKTASAVLLNEQLPDDIAEHGVTPRDLAPDRFTQSAQMEKVA